MLEWQDRWGDTVDQLRQLEADSGITPKALLDMPTLSISLQYYYEAFQELGSSRQYTHGMPVSIQYSELLAYSLINRLTASEAQSLARYVHMFDSAYLKIQGEKIKQSSDSSAGKMPR